jgi:hypothetical protein
MGYTGRELKELFSYDAGRISKFANYKDRPGADVLERIITRSQWVLNSVKKYTEQELLSMSQNKTGLFLECKESPRPNANPKTSFSPDEQVATGPTQSKKRLALESPVAGTEGGATKRQKADPEPLVVTVTTHSDRIAALKQIALLETGNYCLHVYSQNKFSKGISADIQKTTSKVVRDKEFAPLVTFLVALTLGDKGFDREFGADDDKAARSCSMATALACLHRVARPDVTTVWQAKLGAQLHSLTDSGSWKLMMIFRAMGAGSSYDYESRRREHDAKRVLLARNSEKGMLMCYLMGRYKWSIGTAKRKQTTKHA